MTHADDCAEQPHTHVGLCQRAGYANGLADAAARIAHLEADLAAARSALAACREVAAQRSTQPAP